MTTTTVGGSGIGGSGIGGSGEADGTSIVNPASYQSGSSGGGGGGSASLDFSDGTNSQYFFLLFGW